MQPSVLALAPHLKAQTHFAGTGQADIPRMGMHQPVVSTTNCMWGRTKHNDPRAVHLCQPATHHS